MNVDVFVDGQSQNQLLVLPVSPVPPWYRTGWTYYATTDCGDRMFGDRGVKVVEAEIAASALQR